jgi:hypothetical protein
MEPKGNSIARATRDGERSETGGEGEYASERVRTRRLR